MVPMLRAQAHRHGADAREIDLSPGIDLAKRRLQAFRTHLSSFQSLLDEVDWREFTSGESNPGKRGNPSGTGCGT
jgi:hypothetical protein